MGLRINNDVSSILALRNSQALRGASKVLAQAGGNVGPTGKTIGGFLGSVESGGVNDLSSNPTGGVRVGQTNPDVPTQQSATPRPRGSDPFRPVFGARPQGSSGDDDRSSKGRRLDVRG